MTMETGEGTDVGIDRVDDTIDIKRDPKEAAVQTLRDFIGITPDFILEGHTLPSTPNTELVFFGAETIREYNPNQLLARSMLGLHRAVSTIRQENPPLEEGEVVTSDWTIVDGTTGIVTDQRFTATKTGSDFGSFLSCELDHDDASPTPSNDILHVTLPADSYLFETINWGHPHEPVFYASEPDYVSPQWSSEQKSRLPNGGVAERIFDEHRAWFDDNGNFQKGDSRTDVYRRRSIYYRPLYDPSARGIERYVEITQELLRMFLLSYEENRNI